MDDQLDKDISRRIQEVFDNYKDTSADEGWLKLREKFPGERKRRGLVWLWPAAAILFLFIGLGLVMLLNTHRPANHVAGSKPVKQNPAMQNAHKDSMVAQTPVSTGAHTPAQPTVSAQQQSQAESAAPATPRGKRTVAGSNTIAKNPAVNFSPKANTTTAPNKVTTTVPVIATNTGKQVNTSPTQNNVNQPSQTNVLPRIATNQVSPLLAHVDTSNKKGIIANNPAQQVAGTTKPAIVQKDTTAKKAAVAAAKKPSGIDEMFAADQAKSPGELKVKTYMRVKFGVYAATYINYTKNGTNQVNAGGGFTASIPVSKNLRLVTGASVNQNSFNYSHLGGLLAAGAAGASAATFPAGYYTTNSNYKFALGNEVTTPLADYSHSASLLGIDIPLNLQYQFDTRKYPIYVMGGFSSGTFVNESYANVYANGTTTPTDSYKGLNDFYFARTLNFGFGVGYPVGKSQLIIEPFLKYPLTGMGAKQLKFGASGVNLKFNLPTKK